eukprot:scaffold870_cov268-Pinguiococcus_pyrenoidosus.AAC.74
MIDGLHFRAQLDVLREGSREHADGVRVRAEGALHGIECQSFAALRPSDLVYEVRDAHVLEGLVSSKGTVHIRKLREAHDDVQHVQLRPERQGTVSVVHDLLVTRSRPNDVVPALERFRRLVLESLGELCKSVLASFRQPLGAEVHVAVGIRGGGFAADPAADPVASLQQPHAAAGLQEPIHRS